MTRIVGQILRHAPDPEAQNNPVPFLIPQVYQRIRSAMESQRLWSQRQAFTLIEGELAKIEDYEKEDYDIKALEVAPRLVLLVGS
jgi:hypothetical protein